LAAWPDAICAFEKLPAWFARLPWMAATVIAHTATSAAKTPAVTPGTFRLRFGLLDGQRPSAQICAVNHCDSLVGFTGISHFNETEPHGSGQYPVGYECDLFNRTVCFEQIRNWASIVL
jgi:hypothetical protein